MRPIVYSTNSISRILNTKNSINIISCLHVAIIFACAFASSFDVYSFSNGTRFISLFSDVHFNLLGNIWGGQIKARLVNFINIWIQELGVPWQKVRFGREGERSGAFEMEAHWVEGESKFSGFLTQVETWQPNLRWAHPLNPLLLHPSTHNSFQSWDFSSFATSCQ